MSYGMVVDNSLGERIFDTNNYVSLASAYYTTTNSQSPATKTSVPAYCRGDDQDVDQPTVYWTNVAATYSSVFQMAFYESDTGGYKSNEEAQLFRMVHNGVDYIFQSADFTLYGTSPNQYRRWNFDQDVSSFRFPSASRTIIETDKYYALPLIYARPLSSGYTGQFAIWGDATGFWLQDYDLSNNLRANGTNSFEIMICNSAEEFGGINNTAKYTAGSSNYGVLCQTDDTMQYTPSSSLSSFTTFDSRARPAEIVLAVGWAGGTAGTATTYALGGLTSSSVKRWCLMNSTDQWKFTGTNQEWNVKYKWLSNNDISLVWTSSQAAHLFIYTEDALTSKAPFAVAEFGAGA